MPRLKLIDYTIKAFPSGVAMQITRVHPSQIAGFVDPLSYTLPETAERRILTKLISTNAPGLARTHINIWGYNTMYNMEMLTIQTSNPEAYIAEVNYLIRAWNAAGGFNQLV